VLEASTASEALGMMGAPGAEIDMILADVVLPAMGGVELIAEARRRFPALATAYMTGHVGKSARCEVTPEGGTPMLVKPFTPHVLEERVREALLQSGWTSLSDVDNSATEPDGYESH
jgi:two-component system, cell cycle sensor histidine kinase and response regulator CckA